MPARDTDLAAYEAQMNWLRQLSPSRRVELAVAMSEETREVARSGIAARHPEYSASDVHFALLRLLFGDNLYQRAWPDAPRLDP